LTSARAAWVDATGKSILIETLTGKRAIPAAVGLTSGGQLHVGESARNQSLLEPDHATLRLRRLLDTGQRVMLADKSFSPQELVAVVLSQVKELAEQSLGQTVTGLCLAVPCDFTGSQSQAAIAAARLAGFRGVQLVLEPVAVAAAYGLSPAALSPEQPILVCDLGGRSCEAAVLVRDARAASFAVRASAGNNVGSEEYDQRIIAHLAHLAEREFGVSPQSSRKAMARLRLCAEWVKRTLSEQESTTVRLPGLVSAGHMPLDLVAEVSREQLELLIEDDVRRSLQAVEIALREARVAPTQLHAVLLSGGGAEMPLFCRIIEELVVLRPSGAARPEEAIARGAALLGAQRLSDAAKAPSTQAGPAPQAPQAASTESAAPESPSSPPPGPPPGPPPAPPSAPAPSLEPSPADPASEEELPRRSH
jgi:molecular chaperone DnaK